MNQQEVVIIAGPHKTASSTTQKTLISLQKAELLGPYVWPRKYKYTEKKPYNQKQFSKFVDDLISSPSPSKSRDFYVEEMRMIWSKGQSIVIGAERFGTASLSSSRNMLLDGLEEALWRIQKQSTAKPRRTTVVLSFRSERLTHLVSVWNQYLFKSKRKNSGDVSDSFSDWMCSMDCSLPEDKLNLNVVNTLGQVSCCLSRAVCTRYII